MYVTKYDNVTVIFNDGSVCLTEQARYSSKERTICGCFVVANFHERCWIKCINFLKFVSRHHIPVAISLASSVAVGTTQPKVQVKCAYNF